MDGDCDEAEQRLNLFNGDCNYYELEDIEDVSIRGMHEYRVVQLNIQSLPSKFDNLKNMLQRIEIIGKPLDFVLLCEPFLTQVNENNVAIDGYNLVKYTRNNRRDVEYAATLTLQSDHICHWLVAENLNFSLFR